MKKIVNAKIITPYRILENYDVAYENGKIQKIDKNIDGCDEVIDAKGLFLSPGFIDLHIHGGAGFTFLEPDVEKIDAALNEAVSHGVTSVMASHMVPMPELSVVYKDFMERKDGPEVLGMHSECVDWEYIYGDPIHDGMEIHPYSIEKCEQIIKDVPCLKRIGIDPCIEGAAEITRYFVSKGLTVSISHCGPADYNQVMKCVESGADTATHLYTGMFGFYRDQNTGERFPGLIEDCLLEPELMAEVIGNGKHLTGPMLNLIYQAKGVQGMYLITDAAAREEPLKEGEELVQPNHLPDRISIRTMAQLDYIVKHTYESSKIPLLDVIRMVTLNPAKAAKVSDRKGKICEGYDADFVLFDKDINIKAVIARGKMCKKLDGVE